MHATVRVVRAASELGVRVLTFYAFSTENRLRPKEEVDGLMAVLELGLIQFQEEMVAQGVRLYAIGDLDRLPPRVFRQIENTVAYTSKGTGIEVVLAINYGSRDEIRRATVRMLQDQRSGLLHEQDLDETKFASYLDTARWRDPELLIRTSGECRISNFLLWQMSYSEFYFTDTLWPDFDAQHLTAAIQEFQQRSMRLGT